MFQRLQVLATEHSCHSRQSHTIHGSRLPFVKKALWYVEFKRGIAQKTEKVPPIDAAQIQNHTYSIQFDILYQKQDADNARLKNRMVQ